MSSNNLATELYDLLKKQIEDLKDTEVSTSEIEGALREQYNQGIDHALHMITVCRGQFESIDKLLQMAEELMGKL